MINIKLSQQDKDRINIISSEVRTVIKAYIGMKNVNTIPLKPVDREQFKDKALEGILPSTLLHIDFYIHKGLTKMNAIYGMSRCTGEIEVSEDTAYLVSLLLSENV